MTNLALVHALTIFLGAFLLFQVEPIAAKYILPWFGGGPEIWTTCLLFFQMLLVVGYAYAHLLQTRLSTHKQVLVHMTVVITCLVVMGILAFAWPTPIMPGANWKPPDPAWPVIRVLALLTAGVGIPYFVLSATGPLLQAWYARIETGSPYRLYALSNLGSLLALISYPFVVEPWLTVRAQGLVWSGVYVLFAVAMAGCAAALWKRAPSAAAPSREGSERGPRWTQYALWIGLAGCPSLMLLATTNELTRDVAPVPFLWVVPLALYLLSFTICFDNARWYRRGIFHPALGASIAVAVYTQWHAPRIVVQAAVYSALLFAVCMAGHGELARSKPAARHLTAFYIAVALGGAAGGIFAALVAPLLFPGFWEFPLAIWLSAMLTFVVLMRDRESWIHEPHPGLAAGLFASALILPETIGIIAAPVRRTYGAAALGAAALVSAAGLLRPDPESDRGRGLLTQIGVAAGLIALAAVSVALVRMRAKDALLSTRNFYGTLAVFARDASDPRWAYLELRNGQIVHGTQYSAPQHRAQPTTYYSPESGIGLVMRFHPRRDARDAGLRALRVGMVGLGAGTVAAYGEPGDYLRFYEINPAVVGIAAGAKPYFTFVRDSRARVEIVPGDARISMEREVRSGRPQQFDILAVDAFSGDSIPVHLLTREAVQIYLRELRPGGVIAFHVTNAYLDLKPALGALADGAGMRSGWVHNGARTHGGQESDWILLTRDDRVLRAPGIAPHLIALDGVLRLGPWTDDYSSLFPILK